jgi:endoribonuclease Dicer
MDDEEDSSDYVYPTELAKRERFVVPSTGAILTYNTAIGLLGHLCSLIPRDAFTPAQRPRYSGAFASTVHLPPMLPLPSQHLVYEGPRKHSMKEAKRAVAFKAVKALHALKIFDDNLLPVHAKAEPEIAEDPTQTDGIIDVPEMMDVAVFSPWTLGPKLWSHPLTVDGRRIDAGVITGTPLPSTDFVWDGTTLALGEAELVLLDTEDEYRRLRLLQDYTDLGLWWRVSARPRATPLSCFLAPLAPNSCQPDFQAMEDLLRHPYGKFDWAGMDEGGHGHILVMNSMQYGRPFLLQKIRFDLTPMSEPPTDSREAGFPTYWEYYKWVVRKRKGRPPEIPSDGPLLEVVPVSRQTSRIYELVPRDTSVDVEMASGGDARPFILPLASTAIFPMPEEMFSLFALFPRLLHRVQDVWRARCARIGLGLPPILDDRLIEATTLPAAAAGFNNQRLETLGDSVLKLCTSVHLYNKYLHFHEGQLDNLRQRFISNRTLMYRAKAIGLEHFLNVEGPNVKTWPTVVATGSPSLQDSACCDRIAKRSMARRSLQDCMEAIIGAGYLTGGISMALHVGVALGLNFGGPLPWQVRYPRPKGRQPVPARYSELQDSLGYEFQHVDLLEEALTHPSFWSSGRSYQRLEFLGDGMALVMCHDSANIIVKAVVDAVVMTYLFKKFPHANSGQLSSLRARAVCGPALAFIAARVLNLHTFLLADHAGLTAAIEKYLPTLQATSSRDIVLQSWAHDPPKVISDIFESLVAAILIDSGYDFDKTMCIIETAMQCILEVLSPDLPPEPVSAFYLWAAKSGCKRIHLGWVTRCNLPIFAFHVDLILSRKSCSRPEFKRNDTISVFVHDTVVVGPVTASSLPVARAFASEHARMILQAADSDKALAKICDCKDQEVCASNKEPPHHDTVDDTTEIGFATAAYMELERFTNPQEVQVSSEDLEGENFPDP